MPLSRVRSEKPSRKAEQDHQYHHQLPSPDHQLPSAPGPFQGDLRSLYEFLIETRKHLLLF